MIRYDVVILGAGASGLMCAIEAGKRKLRVLVLDHSKRAGTKILMSGGGKCNFTNLHIDPESYLSGNPHFCKSALRQYSQYDFIALVGKHKIPYEERSHGQLFCKNRSADIVNLLLNECAENGVDFSFNDHVTAVAAQESGQYLINTGRQQLVCKSLVVATGGLSYPNSGASPFGYRLAEQFNVPVRTPRAGLVPFTLSPEDKIQYGDLSGIAVDAVVSYGDRSFRENLLFTHRGLSGPVILQISSYWHQGEAIVVNFLPEVNFGEFLNKEKAEGSKKQVKNLLSQYLPKRLAAILPGSTCAELKVNELSPKQMQVISDLIHHRSVKPHGTEGYRTAEVTVGGVDCNEISSKTMECRTAPGLYFIGEVLDVTGWLGGYNLQWAWSSGWCAGQYV